MGLVHRGAALLLQMGQLGIQRMGLMGRTLRVQEEILGHLQ
jgi:hypothetical protein